MGTRLTAVEFFVKEHREKAMSGVNLDRLQREAARAAGDEGRAGAPFRVFGAFWRALNRPLDVGFGRPLQRAMAQRVQVDAEIRKS